MEPNKQKGDAATSKPAADLDARLQAMRLGDPSSSRLQPHHRGAVNPQQVLAPTAAPVVRPPPHMPQSLPHQLQSQPKARSYGGVERSPGDCIRSSMCASPSPSLFGVNSPSFNAPATPTPSVAPKRSELIVSAEEYRPISLSHLSAVQSPSTPISSTSQNSSLDTSALLRVLRADAALSPLTLRDVRDRLLRGQTDLSLLMSAESSAHVVRLLAKGDEAVRRRVLTTVKPVVHKVMGSSEGHAVFLALLRACAWQFDELMDIVDVACNGTGILMRVVERDLGEKALKELIRVVAWQPQLRATLIIRLLGERLMEQRKGHVLLHHCFTFLPYEDCQIIIGVALATIDEMLSSRLGWRCLVECLANARNAELQALEEIIVRRTSVIAQNQYSSNLLKHVLGCGSEQLKVRIAERLAENIVELSLHELGHYVVEACFLRPASPAVLRRVLDAFLGVHDYELVFLVRGCYSSYVVQKLLKTGKHYFPVHTTALATRIVALPAALLSGKQAALVMRVINELLHEQPLQ